jgi:hypothetical protein
MVAAKSTDARLNEHDRQIAAIRKLLLTGMKLLVNVEKTMDRLSGEHLQMRKDLRELRAAQRVTEQRLQGLIAALQRGGNGHRK